MPAQIIFTMQFAGSGQPVANEQVIVSSPNVPNPAETLANADSAGVVTLTVPNTAQLVYTVKLPRGQFFRVPINPSSSAINLGTLLIYEGGVDPDEADITTIVAPLSVNMASNSAFPGAYRNASYPAGILLSTIVGNNDVYTVPTGRKALVIDFTVTNSTVGSIAYYPMAKIGGIYYRLGASKTTTAAALGINYAMAAGNFSMPIVLNAGESFAVNADTIGLTILNTVIIEFADSSPLSRAQIISWSAGNNTLLTVPANKTVFIGNQTMATSSNNPAATFHGLNYFNNSGGSRTVTGVYLVPNAGAPAVNNQLSAPGSVINGTGAVRYFSGNLPAGTSIVFVVDAGTAGQFAWCNYMAV